MVPNYFILSKSMREENTHVVNFVFSWLYRVWKGSWKHSLYLSSTSSFCPLHALPILSHFVPPTPPKHMQQKKGVLISSSRIKLVKTKKS